MAEIATAVSCSDLVGRWKARWGIGRMTYRVPAGVYAVGQPEADSPVVVTANYKMSYDIVRQALAGRDVWLLVLETFGINVWCAAGKGTFGTEEVVSRVESTGLAHLVSHRELLLPILGAPGVAAHEVARRSGFHVRYATLRASDLPEYLDNGMVTTPKMRELTFTLYERLVLVPVEIVHALKPTAAAILFLFVLGALLGGMAVGMRLCAGYLGAMLAGVVLGPMLLPWLPGRAFAVKGGVVGMAWSAAFYMLAGGRSWPWPVTAAIFLALPAISSFYTLNFTGCSTYTSRTGVKKEMRVAIPIMGGAVALSLVLLVAGRFF